jgi:hypothetical protein
MSQTTSGVAVSPAVIAVPADVRMLLDLYISECQYEISGLGTVELRNGMLEVTEIYLLDQVVSSGETVLTPESMAVFMAEAPSKGIDVGKVRLWWHSHATHSVYWSPTDEQAIDSFDTAPWIVSIVGNHAGDYLARIDLFPSESIPVRLGQSAALQTIFPDTEVERVQEEILAHVSKTPEPQYTAARKRTSSQAGAKTTKKD